jgi:type II secretory pathway pseudopilin PulG
MRAAQGFTYLGVLFMVFLVGFAMATAGVVWSTALKRQREQQLLWTGDQFRRAIAGFYNNGPPGLREYPRELADLLEDRRGPVLRRHLRRLYADPVTGEADWQLIRLPDTSIIGVASRSSAQPLKLAGFGDEDVTFENASCYCDWRFVYLPALGRVIPTGR